MMRGISVHRTLSLRTTLKSVEITSRPLALPLKPVHQRYLSTSSPLLKKSKNAASASSSSSSSTKVSKSKGKGKSRETEEDDIDEEGHAALVDTLAKTNEKMNKSVEWAKGVVYENVQRAKGRVTPGILENVKVILPDSGSVSLVSIASVRSQRDSLIVETYDTDHTKHVESAIHKANLPGISPQKIEATVLKIPMPKPTSEQREQIAKSINTTIEAAKQQVRTLRSDAMKSIGGRGQTGSDDIQDLADKFGGALDELQASAKKELDK